MLKNSMGLGRNSAGRGVFPSSSFYALLSSLYFPSFQAPKIPSLINNDRLLARQQRRMALLYHSSVYWDGKLEGKKLVYTFRSPQGSIVLPAARTYWSTGCRYLAAASNYM